MCEMIGRSSDNCLVSNCTGIRITATSKSSSGCDRTCIDSGCYAGACHYMCESVCTGGCSSAACFTILGHNNEVLIL